MITPEERRAADWLREAFAQQRDDDAAARRVYDALKATGRLKDHRLIAYRCEARGCLLLDVVQVPDQVIAHTPRYRLSPSVNEEGSNEAGRAANTVDGDRRWRAQSHAISSAVNFVLNCDHLHGVVIDKADVEADCEARHAEVRVSADGRRAVR